MPPTGRPAAIAARVATIAILVMIAVVASRAEAAHGQRHGPVSHQPSGIDGPAIGR